MVVVKVNRIKIGKNNPLVLIAGPCVIESKKLAMDVAKRINEICLELDIPFIFKSSYDKANRTSISSFRGPGLKEGLKILSEIKAKYNIPILTDVHCKTEVDEVKKVADIIQIPAFLCRQTDLLISVGKTNKPINVKKGQFVAAEDMKYVCEKIEYSGNKKIILTERGSCFGYKDLVLDLRNISIMQSLGYPVCVDVTHSLRAPSGRPQPEFIPLISRAVVAAGCDAIFLEVHPRPEEALSDRGSMLKLNKLKELLVQIKQIRNFSKSNRRIKRESK